MNIAFINLINYDVREKFKSSVDDIVFIEDRNLEFLIKNKKYHLKNNDVILVYEGMNSFVTKKLIKETIETAREYGIAVAGVKIRDTLKEVDENLFVIRTLDRKKFWEIQYPRAIRYDMFKKIKGDIYNIDSLKKLKTKVININSK